MSNPRRKKHLAPPPLSEILGELPEGSPDVLGELPKEPYDSGLRVNQPPPALVNPLEDAQADRLTLPRGALVAIRRSGGFRFRSREVVAYRDGRVNSDDGEQRPRTLWTLGDTEMAELRRALEQANLPKLARSSGRQNPDAFAYEIVGRPSRRAYAAEVFQGSIPESLKPLIQQLSRFMWTDEPAREEE
jgi:hypothetical protein